MNRTGSMWFHSSLVVVFVALAFAAGVAVGFIAARHYTPKNGVHPSLRVIAEVRDIPEPTPRVSTNGNTGTFSF